MEISLFPEMTVNSILIMLFLSLLSASMSLFFKISMDKGMILEKWWLLMCRMVKKGGIRNKLAYILGYCLYCNGFWVSVCIYIAYYKEVSLLTFLFGSLTILFIRVMVKLGLFDF
jgi:hypothetical protein